MSLKWGKHIKLASPPIYMCQIKRQANFNFKTWQPVLMFLKRLFSLLISPFGLHSRREKIFCCRSCSNLALAS